MREWVCRGCGADLTREGHGRDCENEVEDVFVDNSEMDDPDGEYTAQEQQWINELYDAWRRGE